MRLTRRQAVLGTCVGLPAAMFARPGAHLAQSALRDRGEPLAPAPAGFSRDASGLEVAPTETHVLPAAAPERALSELLAKARTARRPVAIAGARHTMGGHTFAPNAIVVDTSELRSIRMRAEVYIDFGSGHDETNEAALKALQASSEEIDAAFGEKLSWESLDTKRACRVACYGTGSIEDSDDKLESYRQWMVDRLLKFKKLFGPRLAETAAVVTPPEPSED